MIDWVHFGVFFLILLLLAKPVGIYICHVLDPKKRLFLDPVLKPVETGIYRLCRVNPLVEQNWKHYLLCILGFSVVSLFVTALLIALQFYLPFNPQKMAAPSWHLNFNTAVSFMTNTNWQSYGGESTMSYFTQMAALTVQNFVSAAVGLAVAAVLVRGIARRETRTIGNFWADLTRLSLYLLLPICIVSATLFMGTGVPQNFQPYVKAKGLETGAAQTIAQGPIASQQAIKLLGTNGGGFTNANSAHPYENPTPLANLLQVLLIFLIPMGQIYYYGYLIHDTKHGWCIIVALALGFLTAVWACSLCERIGNPLFVQMGLEQGNWEGKEQRFGLFGSALYACVTTIISCGSVNCCHDCLTPIGGLFPMLNIQLSEVIFGGVGAGLYSVLLFVFLAVFLAGLIIGRTPEYMGKKIESFDVKMTMLAVMPFVLVIHGFTALSCGTEWGMKALGNTGPHGFSEILYAFSSCAANNGSAFAGLNANNVNYDVTLACTMLLGRFLVIIPVMALAGSFAQKKITPQNSGSFPASSPIFILLLVGVILLLGALTFLPALSMGPIIEQFFMLKGTLFP